MNGYGYRARTPGRPTTVIAIAAAQIAVRDAGDRRIRDTLDALRELAGDPLTLAGELGRLTPRDLAAVTVRAVLDGAAVPETTGHETTPEPDETETAP